MLVSEGKISWWGEIPPQANCSVLNAEGLIVCPGFIDCHCHLRQPGFEDKETIATGTQAAVKGGLNPVRAHAERLPFGDDCFDCILVVDALHHFCGQKEALTDLVRVLKPGGRLVVEEPDISRPIVKLIAWLEKLVLMGSRFLTSDRIERMLQDLGMETHVESDGRFIFWVQAQKTDAWRNLHDKM